MRKQPVNGSPARIGGGVSLQQIINGLVSNSLSTALQSGSKVFNEVDKGIVLSRFDRRFGLLIGAVLEAVILNSRKGDIHIRCMKAGDQYVLQIEERNNYNGYALSFSIGALVPEVNEAGGQLELISPRQRVATVLVSMPKHVAA